jgi:SRSO17 transposase
MVVEEAREQARELGCEVAPRAIAGLVGRLAKFIEPFRRLFGRRENGEHAERYVKGRLTQLPRRTMEPIARQAKVPRRALQQFVGAGAWDDQPVREEFRRQVAGVLGDPDAALIADASGFRKFGPESVGAVRQYCGNIGKVDMCQVGEFLVYASAKGAVLVDAQLYLPREWADDRARRAKADVPREVRFQEGWRLSLQELERCRKELLHQWILADDSYGRVLAYRDTLQEWNERYLLDVPSNTRVVRGNGEKTRADRLAATLLPNQFVRVRTRDGDKGPIEVEAYRERVTPVRDDPSQGPTRPEILLVLRHGDGTFSYHMSNADHAPIASLAKAAAMRHYVEEAFGTAKGDAGMAQYEMRSWPGWHHHMTLTMLAAWFLVLERRAGKRGLVRSPSPWCGTQPLVSSPPPR